MTYSAYIGLDRGDRLIDWTELDAQGKPTGNKGQVANRPESLHAWMMELHRRQREGQIAIGLEQPAGSLIHWLGTFPFVHVYALNPGAVASLRRSYKPSRQKSDVLDAEMNARFVFDRHDDLDPFKPEDPLTRKIEALLIQRRKLVDLRTQLTNRLQGVLKQYYPQALELAGENLYAPLAIAFLRKYPTFQAFKRTRHDTLLTFYRKHGCVRHSALEKRMQIKANSIALTDDQTILEVNAMAMRAIVDQLEPLQRSIGKMEHHLHEAYGEHRDAFIFESLPGSGRIHCARLLAALGTQRERFPTANALQTFCGIAPILFTTGNRKDPLTLRRKACPVFIKQSVHEWAAESIKHSLWAKAYYLRQRAKGKKHHTAVRALAYKWLRIIHRMWIERTRYNEQAYLDSLRRNGSSLITDIDKLANPENLQSA